MRYLILTAALCLTLASAACMSTLQGKMAAAAENGGSSTGAAAKPKALPGGVTVITDATWDVEVIQASNDFPVVVDMYADWCGPCRKLSPILDEISHENKQVKFVKINTDNSSKDDQLGVRGIPTLFIYKNGQVVDKIVGFRAKDALVPIFAAL